MSAHGEGGGPGPEPREPGLPDREEASRRLSGAYSDLTREVSGLARQLLVWTKLQAARVGASMRGIVLLVVMGLVAALALAVVTVASSVLLVLGIRDAVAAASGHQWLGSLAAGAGGL